MYDVCVQASSTTTLSEFLLWLVFGLAMTIVGVTIGAIKDRNFRAFVGGILFYIFSAIFGTIAGLVALFLLVKFIKWAWYF